MWFSTGVLSSGEHVNMQMSGLSVCKYVKFTSDTEDEDKMKCRPIVQAQNPLSGL